MKKTLSGWQHMLLQNLFVPFGINVAFTDVQVIHAIGTNTPPHHHRCCLLNFALVTTWMVLFLVSPEDTISVVFKKQFECDLITP